MGPNRRCDLASSSARLPTASDPAGVLTSMPMSDPSWRQRDGEGSASSQPSVLPFVETLWLPHSPPNAAASDLLVGIGYARQHFLYFFPLPHGHGSLRPTLAGRGDAWVFCRTRAASSQGKPPPGR